MAPATATAAVVDDDDDTQFAAAVERYDVHIDDSNGDARDGDDDDRDLLCYP